MNKNIKVAKELVKLAKLLIAENDFQKMERIKQKLKQLNRELNNKKNSLNDMIEKIKEYLSVVKEIKNPPAKIKKIIRNIQNQKYHLLWDTEIDVNGQHYEVDYGVYIKNKINTIASLERRISEYENTLKDLSHKFSGKSGLLNAKLPDSFEQAMQHLKKQCILLTEQNIKHNISDLQNKLTDQNIWFNYSRKNKELLKHIDNSDYDKVIKCTSFDDFKEKINNNTINYIDSTYPKESYLRQIQGEINLWIKPSLQSKLKYQKERNAEKQGTYWYQQQRIKLLGQLAQYCDDILEAFGLRMADNGQFNVTVKSSNGIFNVFTSSVIGHYREQGYNGTWVRPHWRLTVRRING